ncbi:hypothetical protein CYY_009239 [Polysphondylium violaceum]|uniref:ER membrane protein complex subunit 3 n=1 Tax=Polysphondylium violaceum TaxID=133409 RepID=A0A8J4PTZ4_9MYCE|nr:hypothetical protein CYY_009239 [Polysphondylium violaceum]
MIEQPIVLDVAIRNWVVIPILLVLFVVSALKMNFTKIMQIQSDRKQDLQKTMEMQTVARTRKLTAYYNRIPQQGFLMRKAYFTNKETGILTYNEPPQEENNPMDALMQASLMNDSSGMTDMLKGNVVHLIPQISMMTWVNHFFSGFVACKLPFFPLTIRFKSFLQRGIELSSLDVSYVSSLSWYFLCWFGSEGINAILLGENIPSMDQQLFQSQVDQGPPNQQVPIHKVYNSERENIDMIRYESLMDNVEERFLNNLTKKTTITDFSKVSSPSSSSSSSSSVQSKNKVPKRR